MTSDVYYRADLSLVHHLGFGFHADACAPGLFDLLEPVKDANGVVLELGCGSGLLTKKLVDAGYRVIATDASPDMLDIARRYAPGAEIRRLVLPDDPLPEADAIVGVGHVLNYLPDEAAIERAWVAIAGALRPGGVLAIDICDFEWAEARRDLPSEVRMGDDWLIVHRFSIPSPNRFERDLTTFLRNDDGSWRRDDEHHDNVLLDTTRLPGFLARHGIEAEVRKAFGSEDPPVGLRAVIGRKPDS